MSYKQLYNPNITFRGVVPDEVVVSHPVKVVKRSRPNLPALSAVRGHVSRTLSSVDSMRLETHSLLLHSESMSSEEWEAALHTLQTQKSELQRLLSTLTDTYVEGVQRALRRRTSRRTRLKRLKREVRRQRENERRKQEEMEIHLNQERRRKEEELVQKQQKVERSEVSVSRRWSERLKLVRVLTRARTLNRTPDVTYANTHLDKLISLWSRKISRYESEEGERAARDEGEGAGEGAGAGAGWRGAWFGGEEPRREFADLQHFLRNRGSWDVYVCECGSAPPPGWVSPPRP